MELLRGMSPSAIDKEFRSLSAEAGGGSEKQLLSLLQALLYQLNTRQDYELTQAHLGLVLKVKSHFSFPLSSNSLLSLLYIVSLENHFTKF